MDQSPEQTFGQIKAPEAVDALGPGAVGISKFLTNMITLIYEIAGIVLVFMLVWGAFEWLISGGEKEKLAAAQKKIVSAIVGIILLAVAFAVIQIIGIFTGFTLFEKRIQLSPDFNRESNCEDRTYVCKSGWDCIGGPGEDGHGCRRIR